MPSDRCLSLLSVMLVYCGQTVGWIKMKPSMQAGLGHIVLDGDPVPPPPNRRSPLIFSQYLLWPNGWMDKDATWYGGRPQPTQLCVRWGPSSPPKKRAEPPNFQPMSIVAKQLDGPRRHLAWRWASVQATLCKMGTQLPSPIFAHFYCGQMVGCIKMPLGTEVGLSPGDVVLDRDQLPQKIPQPPPQFLAHVYCGQMAVCIRISNVKRLPVYRLSFIFLVLVFEFQKPIIVSNLVLSSSRP